MNYKGSNHWLLIPQHINYAQLTSLLACSAAMQILKAKDIFGSQSITYIQFRSSILHCQMTSFF